MPAKRNSSTQCVTSRLIDISLRIATIQRNPTRHRLRILVCGLIAALINNSPVLAALPPRTPIVTLGTGINRETNQPLATGVQDANYTLTAVPPESPPNLVALIGSHPTVLADAPPAIPNTYLTGSPGSRWLGIINSVYVPDSYYVLQGNPYVFETSFELTTLMASTAQIDGLRTAVDNKLIGIRVNGTSIFNASVSFAEEFKNFTQFPDGLGQGLFRSGTNTIDFVLDNHVAAPSPLALRIEGQVTAAVPEPGVVVSIAVAVIVMASWLRERKNNSQRRELMNRESKGTAPTWTLLLVLLSGQQAAAAPPVTFTPGNIIVHNSPSGQDDLYEYTPAGVFVQQVPVVPRMGGQDLVIDRDGRVNINNSPTLNIYSPATNSFSTRTFAGWSTVGNLTYGGIAAFDRYVYAADMETSPAPEKGVIRFDLDGGPTMRFATTTDPIDLNIGLDGLLYTLSLREPSNGGGTRIDVFNPISMAFIRGFDLAEEHRAVAVDFDGHIYAAQRDNVSRVNHFSPTGALLDSIADPGVGGFADIDINRNGQLVIASHGGMLLVTTTALDSIISFQTRASNGVNFASWIPRPIPEPSAIALLASGMMILAAVNRTRRRQLVRSRMSRRSRVR